MGVIGRPLNFPPELLCQIALHLPLPRDVLTFGLIHSRVRKALSTPALFKARLAFQGWDVRRRKHDNVNLRGRPFVPIFRIINLRELCEESIAPSAPSLQRISERYFGSFLAQHILLLAAGPQTLTPPSLPYINDELFKPERPQPCGHGCETGCLARPLQGFRRPRSAPVG
ncbi:hypothetical protein BC826DRAFT_1111189 [Russula brevipes]|nr:hypothetical protein BC826DRAFT_1111189 [Russula brevipes]